MLADQRARARAISRSSSPFILAYTAWSWYLFRAKVKLGEGL
jgi:hypothetical protein